MTNGEGLLIQFFPLLVINCILGGFMVVVARILGKNKALWFVLSLIPILNGFFIFVAGWKAICDLHERLKALELGKTFS